MIVGFATLALAAQVTMATPQMPQVEQVQYYRRVPVHPPPCGDGWDVSARDGMCYPTFNYP